MRPKPCWVGMKGKWGGGRHSFDGARDNLMHYIPDSYIICLESVRPYTEGWKNGSTYFPQGEDGCGGVRARRQAQSPLYLNAQRKKKRKKREKEERQITIP